MMALRLNEAVLSTTQACSLPSFQQCNCSLCTLHSSSFLSNKCCAFQGVPANLLAFEEDDLLLPRLAEFNGCTGAIVTHSYVAGGEDAMQSALEADVGTRYTTHGGTVVSSEGGGVHDAYIVQAPWIPTVVEGLENLSPRISRTPEINWFDVSPIAREVVQYDSSVRALPLDTDNIALGWRQDVFERHSMRPPETLEELAAASEFLNGKDHNGDGLPDFGFCLSPQPNYFYAFMAPVFYSTRRECNAATLSTYVNGARTPPTCNGRVTGQNMFFDVETFEPLVDNPGFRYVVDLHRRVLASSNCQEQQGAGGHYTNAGVRRADFRCDRRKAMAAGRCAGVISMPGTMTKMLLPWDRGGSTSPQPRFDERSYSDVDYDPRGNLTWQVQTATGEHWGRRLRFPGSTKLYDHSRRELVNCTPVVCPKAIPHSSGEVLVNYAPFFAEGGESYAIRATAASQKKEIMFDFMAWFASLPIDILPLTGIYRSSQLSEPARLRLVSSGWPEVMVDDLFELLQFYFRDDETEGGNAVKDLLIPGFSEYMRALHEELYDRFLLNLTVSFGGLSQSTVDASFDGFVSRLTQRYNTINAKYGKLGQLDRWRKAMNMPSLSRTQLCAWPDPSALTPLEASSCASADVRPCIETGCGRFAECRASVDATELVLCTCTSSDTVPASDFQTSRACMPTVASTDQQRVFWTLAMLFFGVGLVLCLVVVNEFWRNPLFSPSQPGGTMWSFAVIAVPDVVLCGVYFVFYFTTLIKGVEMSAGPCKVFALLTNAAVYATFLGPPIVALVTLRKFVHVVRRGTVPAETHKVAVATVLWLPWTIGIVIGLVANADGMSGSYRGLLCYNTEWDSLSTGGLTITVFGLSAVVTAAAYMVLAHLFWSSFRTAANTTLAERYLMSALKRGGALVVIYFVSWTPFVCVVGLNMHGHTVSLTTEMLAALIIPLQPILDTFVLLQTPAVRKAMISRIFGQLLVVNANFNGSGTTKPAPPQESVPVVVLAGGDLAADRHCSSPPHLAGARRPSSLPSMGSRSSSDYITVPSTTST